MFLWCVQEVAELKEEDIISHCTATATQLPTVLGELVIVMRTAPVIKYNHRYGRFRSCV